MPLIAHNLVLFHHIQWYCVFGVLATFVIKAGIHNQLNCSVKTERLFAISLTDQSTHIQDRSGLMNQYTLPSPRFHDKGDKNSAGCCGGGYVHNNAKLHSEKPSSKNSFFITV